MFHRTSFYRRYGLGILFAAALTIPYLVWSNNWAAKNSANDVQQWLTEGLEAASQYHWFLEHFTTDEMIVVSWPGCTSDDPRLEALAAKLNAEADFAQMMSGPEMLERLMGPPTEFSRQTAVDRLAGIFFGADQRTTCLVVVVAKTSGFERRRAVETIRRVSGECGVAADELRMGGPVVASVAIDEEGQLAFERYGRLSALVALVLAWLCVRSFRLACTVFLTSLLAATGSLAFVALTGGRMSALLGVMPPLVLVLTIAGAVHLVNYYLDAIRGGARNPVSQAVRNGWLPCTLASATTSVGMGSLTISGVVPVKDFGAYSAVGLGISLTCLLLILPSALEWLPSRAVRKISFPAESARRRWWAWLNDFVGSHHGWIVGVSIVLMAVAGYGLTKMKTSVQLLDLFAPRARMIQDYRWLEQHLGALVPMEVIVRFDSSCQLDLLERIDLVRRAGERVQRLDQVNVAMSAAVFTQPIPQGTTIRAVAQRSVLRKKLTRHLEEFRNMRLLVETPTEELWRISLRVGALNDPDHARFVSTIQQQIEPLLAAERGEGATGISAVYTGGVPLIHAAQQQLLDDLVRSFLTAFVLIAAMMMIMLRSVSAGLLSMTPNLFPAVLIFGTLGWCGVRVDIGTMMNASIALGIAVDDTLHFVTWFRRSIGEGHSRSEAVRQAYQRCAPAMAQTTLICGLGMLAMVFSTFVPSSRFGWMMFALLTAALVGDLLLLPAILVGPLGRCFERRRLPPGASLSAETQ